jgi:hypothetical protein
MSQSTLGEIRPTATVSRPTIVKRIRRKLAERGNTLLITRDNSQDRQALGRYAVLDAGRVVLQKDAELDSLARFLGALADDESIEADHQWHSVIINITDSAAISVPHRFDILASTEADQESLDAIESGSLKEAIDAAMRLMSGWRYVHGPDGKPMAFSRASVLLMLDSYPHSGPAIAEALLNGDAHA